MSVLHSKKIVLLGHFGVGKTSLIRRFVDNVFSKDYKVTIGVHVYKKDVRVLENETVSLIIWDLEGADDINKTRMSYLLGTHAIIYVFDLSRPLTYKDLNKEVAFLDKNFPNATVKVVGNKMYLVNKEFIKQNKNIFDDKVDYFTSAKLGSRFETLFSKLANELK